MDLECDDEPLSPAQIQYLATRKPNFQDTQGSVNEGIDLNSSSNGPVRLVAEKSPSTEVQIYRLDSSNAEKVQSSVQVQIPDPDSPKVSQLKIFQPTIPPTTGLPKPPDLRTFIAKDPRDAPLASVGLNDYPALKAMVKIIKGNCDDNDVNYAAGKAKLDEIVKTLLANSPKKLVDWIIQNSLVLREQFLGSSKLILISHKDAEKYPLNAGYEWRLREQPSVTVSIFKGSIFEQSNLTPTEIVMLMYLWSLQTKPEKVTAWMTISLEIVDIMYSLFRNVCRATVELELREFQGTVEVCLFPFKGPNAFFESRLDILGVLSSSHPKLIRYFLIESSRKSSIKHRTDMVVRILQGKILENSDVFLGTGLDKSSFQTLGPISITDNCIDLQIENSLRIFMRKDIREILTPLKSRIFQQFLDEVTFRDMAGDSPIECFDKLKASIAKQTQLARECSISVLEYLFGSTDDPIEIEIPDVEAPLLEETRETLQTFNNGSCNGDPKAPPVRSLIDLSKPRPSRTHKRRTFPTQDESPPKQIKKRNSMQITSKPDELIRVRQDSASGSKTKKKVGKSPMDFLNESRGTLQTFYYGSCDGDPEILCNQFKSEMAFKCPSCRIVCMTNIDFMKHISGHAQMPDASARDLVDLLLCDYCFKAFDSVDQQQSHLDLTHLLSNSQFVCKLCSKGFLKQESLIAHMRKSHVGAEAPYFCSSCGFRSYSYTKLMDHFFEAHDLTSTLLCTFCLKTFSMFNEKRTWISTMPTTYYQHVLEHNQTQNANCQKCCLKFTSAKVLKEHISRDHFSIVDSKNFRFYNNEERDQELVSLADPENGAISVSTKPPQSAKHPTFPIAYPIKNLEDLKVYKLSKDDACLECNTKLASQGHSMSFIGCTRCGYSTSCSRAMNMHEKLFHGSDGVLKYTIGSPTVLEKELTCKCGFSSKFGNTFATHLVSHL